jgi:hypothetical protein
VKKNLMNATLLVAGLIAPVVGVHAESLHMHVPFAFTASGTALPAGDYSITEVQGHPTVLLIAATNSSVRAMVFARQSTETGSGSVKFVDRGEEEPALATVKTPTGSFELSIPAPSRTSLAKSGVGPRTIQ